MSSAPLVFVAERESNRYVTVFDGETLYLLENVSGKVARTAVESLNAGQSAAEALGEKAMTIPASEMTRIRTAEHDDFVQVRFNKAGAEKHHVVAMPNLEDQLALVRAVGATFPDVEEQQAPIPVLQALIGPGFATVCVVGATTVFLMLARDVAAGVEIDTSGRRGGLKLLLAKILDVIGPSGVIGIGALALAGSLYWGYQRFKSPPILTTFERSAQI
ncbi:MAG: hypothetical protein R3C49_13325 [Planctomycetaceae bacterium]